MEPDTIGRTDGQTSDRIGCLGCDDDDDDVSNGLREMFGVSVSLFVDIDATLPPASTRHSARCRPWSVYSDHSAAVSRWSVIRTDEQRDSDDDVDVHAAGHRRHLHPLEHNQSLICVIWLEFCGGVGAD